MTGFGSTIKSLWSGFTQWRDNIGPEHMVGPTPTPTPTVWPISCSRDPLSLNLILEGKADGSSRLVNVLQGRVTRDVNVK